MKIKYKRVKVPMPHCGDCGEELSGNGSIMMPYKCKCGTWTTTIGNPFEYELMSKESKQPFTK